MIYAEQSLSSQFAIEDDNQISPIKAEYNAWVLYHLIFYGVVHFTFVVDDKENSIFCKIIQSC